MMMLMLMLAQVTPTQQTTPPLDWSEVTRQFRDGGDSFANTELFFAAVALLIVAVGLAALTRWHQQRKLRSKPLRTFHRMANALHLSLKEQWLLARIARHQALPNPITLLLSPATFSHHADAYVQPLGTHRRSRVRSDLRRVQQRIFGE